MRSSLHRKSCLQPTGTKIRTKITMSRFWGPERKFHILGNHAEFWISNSPAVVLWRVTVKSTMQTTWSLLAPLISSPIYFASVSFLYSIGTVRKLLNIACLEQTPLEPIDRRQKQFDFSLFFSFRQSPAKEKPLSGQTLDFCSQNC